MHEFSLSHIPRKAWPGAVFGENGQSYEVDADFRTVLKCLRVLRDEDIRERDRLYLLKQWFFRGQAVPGGLEKFIGFAFGECREPSGQPRMMDFEQDADAIYASFLMAYGMDLTEIGDMTGMSETTILNYELGYMPIAYDKAKRLAKALEIDEKLLFDDYCRFLDYPFQL